MFFEWGLGGVLGWSCLVIVVVVRFGYVSYVVVVVGEVLYGLGVFSGDVVYV